MTGASLSVSAENLGSPAVRPIKKMQFYSQIFDLKKFLCLMVQIFNWLMLRSILFSITKIFFPFIKTIPAFGLLAMLSFDGFQL